MSTQTTLAMLAVALLAANQGALAQGDPPAGPPKELAQLESYEGSWVCHGSAPEGPLGPAHTSTTTVKIHGELDGMWFSGSVEEAAHDLRRNGQELPDVLDR